MGKHETRDRRIRVRWQAGVSIDTLAQDYGLHPERVRQIVGPRGLGPEGKRAALTKATTASMALASLQASLRPAHVKAPMWSERWYLENDRAFVEAMRLHYRETRLTQVNSTAENGT